MNHVMIDLETWGTSPGSHLRSIGAIQFDPRTGEMDRRFYVNVAPLPTFGLTTDAATVQWWSEQSAESQAALEVRQVTLPVALMRLTDWLRGLGHDLPDIRLWAHGPNFDVTLLEAAYRAAAVTIPWHYRAPRDTRTIFEAASMRLESVPAVGTLHNALDDAEWQARAVIEAYRRLGDSTAHSKRVDELLGYNNVQVERRRASDARLRDVLTHAVFDRELNDDCIAAVAAAEAHLNGEPA